MNIAHQLREFEEQLLRTEFRRDRKGVSDLLADDFCEFGSSGRIWNKQQILDHLESGSPFKAVMEDFQAMELAPEVFLVTYKVIAQSFEHEDRKSLRSSVWVKREGRWQMLFHQGTLIPAHS